MGHNMLSKYSTAYIKKVYIGQGICAEFWQNCGFDDKSMKFGMVVEKGILDNIRWRPTLKIQNKFACSSIYVCQKYIKRLVYWILDTLLVGFHSNMSMHMYMHMTKLTNGVRWEIVILNKLMYYFYNNIHRRVSMNSVHRIQCKK